MKSIVVSMTVAAGLMIAGSAMAADMPDVAKKNNCTACHAIDKKVVGPSSWMFPKNTRAMHRLKS
jgi:cytochrome c551/c552